MYKWYDNNVYSHTSWVLIQQKIDPLRCCIEVKFKCMFWILSLKSSFSLKNVSIFIVSAKENNTEFSGKMAAVTWLSYRAFSHDVTATILLFQSNETAAMLVFQTSPVGVGLFSYINALFVPINLHNRWHREWKRYIRLVIIIIIIIYLFIFSQMTSWD